MHVKAWCFALISERGGGGGKLARSRKEYRSESGITSSQHRLVWPITFGSTTADTRFYEKGADSDQRKA